MRHAYYSSSAPSKRSSIASLQKGKNQQEWFIHHKTSHGH
jgi:hypothetical protein